MIRHQCKAVVVGTGAGGAVAGAMLAEAGIDTILVEQGRHFHPEDHRDVLSGINRMYLDGGMTVTIGNPPIPLPLGRAVGGTTIINSSTCFRPPLDRVASWGGPTWEELEPCCAEVERRINAHTVDIALLGGNWRVLKRGCDAMGIEIKPLKHNVKDCKGHGRCQYGCKEGAKQSTDLTFIPSALAAGAKLLAEHRVDRVIADGGRAIGVAGVSSVGEFEIRADAVVLALGTFATPAFLLRRGLANSSKRVGRGLQIHPGSRVVALFDEIVDGNIGLPQGAYIDHWADRGLMCEGIFTPPGLLIASIPGAGHDLKDIAAHYRQLAAFGVMVSDTARGRVYPGRFGVPFIAKYQVNQPDAANLRFGIARLAELYFAAGAKRVFTGFLPIPVIENRDALESFESAPLKPAYLEMMAFHPVGTCAMGSDAKTSVVDFSLETHDLPGLHIMDASVIPNSLGVNPQVTIMTLAMRAAKILAEKMR